ncbi:hypothetical protein VTK26DRAFT_6331 [Humicola hyalothermophila]
MPTTHVQPGCDSLLQDIANSLWKARKVVVITGAGISTNSGIPDFRSENGLYSLIQAQFDAAQKQVSAGNCAVDAPGDPLDNRPPKRRRISRADPELPTQQPSNLDERPCQQPDGALRKEDETDKGAGDHQRPTMPLAPKNMGGNCQPPQAIVKSESDTTLPSTELSADPSSKLLPSLRPTVSGRDPENTTPNRTKMGFDASMAASPPPLNLGTPRPRLGHHLENLRSWSSSPLSSPPPIMFDPYRESSDDSSSSSSSEDRSSSRFPSEEPSSTSTPLLTSQPSFGSSSSRSSLPNMKGRDLFDAQIWSCPIKTSVFYTFATTLRQKVRAAEPTSSHRFVSVLRDSRKLVRCYTQNIDQLEERVGLTTSLSLGAGSRYRFSTRSARNAAGAKSSAKVTEESGDGSQGTLEQGKSSQSKQSPVAAPGEDSADGTLFPTQSSQSGLEPDSTPSDAAAASSTSAPAAPKRGVECVFLHGSLAELRCFVCARTASWDDEDRLADTLAGRQPTCPHCAGATAAREEKGKRALGVGKLRPDIVLYGEDHPHAHLISPIVQHDLSLGPDMLLILGTSMRVHGLKVLVKEFAKAVHDRGGKVVFVNFTKPPESVWADIIDYWVQWDCDAWVCDLQRRKPALWLPPGSTLPEEEKSKPAKSSRRQSGVDGGKRKEGSDKPSKKVKEGQADVGVDEASGLSTPQNSKSEELPQAPPPPAPNTVPKPPPRPAREPKLNPNAKRPASIRDHKQNGAYCVWKILGELRRITGRSPPPVTAPSLEVATRPKAKKPRKSAPATLESHNVHIVPENAPEVQHEEKRPHLASSPAPRAPSDEPASVSADSSISAAVKNRKRKQAVTWRMIGGVETRVSLSNDEQAGAGVTSSPLPHTTAILRPSPAVNDNIPRSKRLPRPVPTPQQQQPSSSFQTAPQNSLLLHHNQPHPHHPHYQLHQPYQPQPTPLFNMNNNSNNSSNSTTNLHYQQRPHIDPDAGFRETDRLIAKAHLEVRLAAPPCRPTTPPLPPLPRSLPLRLPPLDLSNLNASEPAGQRMEERREREEGIAMGMEMEMKMEREKWGGGAGGGGAGGATMPTPKPRPKPAAIEPKVVSPGPGEARIPSNVGSPVEDEVRRRRSGGVGISGANGNANASRDPFFWADPGLEWFGFPPRWMGWPPGERRRWAEAGERGRGAGEGDREEAGRGGEGAVMPGRGSDGRTGMDQSVGVCVPRLREERAREREPGYRLEVGTGTDQRLGEGLGLAGGGAVVEAWCPDEQLRKEQEAALMLSAMRGVSG